MLLLNNTLYYGNSTASANGIDPSNRYSNLDVGHEYVLQ